MKDAVGWLAWMIASRIAALRPLLAPIGLRTWHHRWQGREGQIRLLDGSRLWITRLDTNYLSFELFWKGWSYYEPMTLAVVYELLRGGRAFVDIGANIGYFALNVAAWFPGIQVVAFEPNPKLVVILRDNAARNGFPVRIEPIAMSDRSGRLDFYLPESDMSGSLEAAFNPEVQQVIQVHASTVDAYVDAHGLGGPMLIKIDTEGHEPAVLRGMQRTIAGLGPDLVLEVTQDYDADTVAWLRSCGYSFYSISDRPERRDALTVTRHGSYVLLNHLATRRATDEVVAILERARQRVSHIDPRRTSLFRTDGA